MRNLVVWLLLALLVLPLSLNAEQERGIGLVPKKSPASSSYVKGERLALLIGNNDYVAKKWPDLKTAVKDVAALAKVLIGRYGFTAGKVILQTNATRRQMLDGFNKLAKISTAGDSVLIYYAGHGEFDKEQRGWWVPVDGKDNTDYISNEEILGRLRAIKANHKLLIVDSCFSGNLLTRGVATAPKSRRLPSRYVVEKTKLASVQGLSSGGNEPVSDGGAKWGGHSIFAYHLLGQLKANQKPYLSAELLGYTVSEQVANDTASIFGTGQTPIVSAIKNQGDQGGDFFFVPDPSTIIGSQTKVALFFVQPAAIDTGMPMKGAQLLITQRVTENLRSLYIPVVDEVFSLAGSSVEGDLAAMIRKAKAEAALVMNLSGEMKRENTLMWQGHTTLFLSLTAFRLKGDRLVKLAEYDLEPQRLPMRKWSTERDIVEGQLTKTAEKLLRKISRRKLNQFLETVKN